LRGPKIREVEAPGDALARFVSRLFDTPALRQLAALQKEEQGLQFLRVNGPRLQPVFVSLGMDVSRGWREASASVAAAIRAESDRILAMELASMSTTRLTLSFFPALAGGRQPPPRAREELHALFQRLAARPVSRAALSGSLAAARSELTDKYIPQAVERRKYIAVEVSRVQRLNLSATDLADLLRFALMLRPAAYLSITPGDTPEKDAGFTLLQGPYVQKVLAGVSGLLPSFPLSLIGMGLHSVLAFPATASLEAVSRLAAILALRGRALTPALVVDRGADSPDKSWFNVNRKNARWHGLDPLMLDELYTIAAENGW
jgi:hypothetical protein